MTSAEQHQRRQTAEVRRLHEAHEAEIDDINEHARLVSARGLVQRGQQIAQARHQARLAAIDREMDLLEVERALFEARGHTGSGGAVPGVAREGSGPVRDGRSANQRLRDRAVAVGVKIAGKSNPQLRREVETEERRQGITPGGGT